jgi:RNA polymerase sigma-70 factor (sigma-E family)
VTVRLGPDFDAFVRSSSSTLLRTAYLLTGDRGHAEDLLQTALLRTARSWSRAREAPTAYARRVLVNLSKDSLRRQSRRPVETALAGVQRPVDVARLAWDPVEAVLLRSILLEATRRLPARQRTVLVLRFFEELSVDEVAVAMGCSPGTVKSQTHHALARLRDYVEVGEGDLAELTGPHGRR